MNQKGAKAAGHHRHEGLLALFRERETLGMDLTENVISVEGEGSSHKRYMCAGSAVAEILGEGPARHMRVNCEGILLQGRKDEPVTASVVKLKDGTQCLLLAEESLFTREPKMRGLVVPRRSFGGSSNTRHIPLSKITEGFVPVRQFSPTPGLMGIVFKKPFAAA